MRKVLFFMLLSAISGAPLLARAQLFTDNCLDPNGRWQAWRPACNREMTNEEMRHYNQLPPSTLLACETDTDCALAQTACGSTTVINQTYQDTQRLAARLQATLIECAALVPEKPMTPVCINTLCQIKE